MFATCVCMCVCVCMSLYRRRTRDLQVDILYGRANFSIFYRKRYSYYILSVVFSYHYFIITSPGPPPSLRRSVRVSGDFCLTFSYSAGLSVCICVFESVCLYLTHIGMYIRYIIRRYTRRPQSLWHNAFRPPYFLNYVGIIISCKYECK